MNLKTEDQTKPQITPIPQMIVANEVVVERCEDSRGKKSTS